MAPFDKSERASLGHLPIGEIHIIDTVTFTDCICYFVKCPLSCIGNSYDCPSVPSDQLQLINQTTLIEG